MLGETHPLRYLREHPIICLLLLSPGIPEYLSGSSPINALVFNPFQFLFQIIANLGLYVPGVILIREALVRWKKRWGSVLILGAAYGILEEGIGLSTLFNPLAGPVGKLGFYGHFAGVNWIWVASILPVHMIFSISIPILLVGLAMPETNGESLVSRKGIAILFAILTLDVAGLFLLIFKGEHFWMGWPIFIGSLIAIGLLVLIAKRIPADLVHARGDRPRASPLVMGVIGVLFYTSVLITVSIGESRLSAALDLILVIADQAIFLFLVLALSGRNNNARQLLGLVSGLIVPIAIVGMVSQARLPLVIIADLAFIIFIWRVLQKHKAKPVLLTHS